jgi:hypothetical protein
MNITNSTTSQYNAYSNTTLNKADNTNPKDIKTSSFNQTVKDTSKEATNGQSLSELETIKHFTLAEQSSTNTTVGNFRIATAEEINLLGEQKGFSTRFEAAVFSTNSHQDFDDYFEMTQDPQKIMDQSKEGYVNFKTLAKKALTELNGIDKTNSYNITITDNQAINITLKDGIQRNATNSADYEKMQTWITENKTELTESSKAYSDYALSKSIRDYEKATGINREVLMERSSIPIEGREGAFKASTTELDEYLMKMTRYASNAFSNNPKSYAEIDAMGHPGYPIYSSNKPDSSLPNMS